MNKVDKKLLVFHHVDLDGYGVKAISRIYGFLKGYEEDQMVFIEADYYGYNLCDTKINKYLKDKEDELKAIHAQIRADSRAIHMSEAEWAALNDPDRLAKLISAETKWQPLAANQVQDEDTLPVKAAPVPKSKPQFDPIPEVQP